MREAMVAEAPLIVPSYLDPRGCTLTTAGLAWFGCPAKCH